MNKQNLEITCENYFSEFNTNAILMKISHENFELNVCFELFELNTLILFLNGDKNYICAGKSANNKTHWENVDGNSFLIILGDDLETWDICLSFKISTKSLILNELKNIIN